MKKIVLTVTGFLAALLPLIAQNTTPALPTSITFEHKVMQLSNDEDGKATTTFWFTTDGNYALAKHKDPDGDESTVLYTKDGQMCMIDEDAKTITVMNIPKAAGDISKAISKDTKNLEKDKEPDLVVKSTGKTKTICGFTAYEYVGKNEGGSVSWWYAKVDFDPVLVYTMGAGKLGDMSAIKNKSSLNGNPFAIVVQNKNYLMAEVESGGKKGLETTGISKTTYSFSTAGYTVKKMGGLKQALLNKVHH